MNTNHELEYYNNFPGVLVSLLIGSLVGAITMLLLAPQSGKRTRMLIQKRGLELFDRTTDIMDDTMSQVRSSKNRLTMTGRKKARKFLQQGQELVAEQLDHVSKVAEAGKKAVKAL
jgi:gas vesicle protein